jgi:hypothetical protein
MTGISSRLRRLERHVGTQEQEVILLYIDHDIGSEEEALRVRFTPIGNLFSDDGGRTWRLSAAGTSVARSAAGAGCAGGVRCRRP